MSIIFRKILLVVSVLLFLGLSIAIVLYALGYRIDNSAANPLPVGVLITESIPTRASVELNGQSVGRTPRSITNLSPGTVDLSVSFDNYIPWEKQLPIQSGQVTEARDIRLFPQNPSFKTLLSNTDKFSLSPHRRLIAALTDDRHLFVIDEDGLNVIPPLKFTVSPDDLLWSPDSSSLLVITANEVSLIRLTDRLVQPVRLSLLDAAVQLAWDQRIPGRIYAITSNHDFIAYSVSNQSSQTIVSNIMSFATSSRQLFLLDQENQLQSRNLQGGIMDTPFINDDRTISQLHVTPGGHIAFSFADRSAAVLSNDGLLVPVANNVAKIAWSPDEQLLMVQLDDSSLHVINVFDERLGYLPLHELRLVTRLSRPIRNPQWFAGGRHLIYQIDDEILITEIDTRDHPLTYSVDTTNLGDANATVGLQGSLVLYLKKTAESTRLTTARLLADQL